MMKFKNTKMAKAISGFVGLSTAVMMMGPAVASAATVEELTAQINALLAQVSALQATQSGSGSSSTMTSGHMFNVDLTIGSKGADVVALQEILTSKGYLTMPAGVAMGYFGNLTKSAVAAWQAASGITPAAGYVGPKSRAALNAMGGTTTTTTTTTTTSGLPAGCTSTVGFSVTTGQSCASVTAGTPSGTGVSVMLDTTSPSSRTLISPSGVATLAVFKISNGGSSAAKVTMLKMKRTGISSDVTLNNVYLYDGMGNRISDAASVSTGNISFSDSAGVVTVPAMGTMVVSVRADIATGMNGQTIGVMLTEMTADAGTVSGLPVSGAEHTLATAPSGIASADFTGSFTPNGGSIDPQTDYVVWQKNLSIGNRDALISTLRLQQIGSVYQSDVKNLRLMIDGVQVGTAVDMPDTNRFVTFNFATPVTVKAGSHVVKVLADVVGGSNRNFQFSLRRVVDVEIWDSQLNVVVTPTVGGIAFTAVEGTGSVSINAGTLTVSKDTSSPSGNLVKNGSAVTLAKFKFKAQGEKLKVENLRFSFTASNGAVGSLRNGAVYLDGVQVGSTATLNEDSQGTPYTQFNLGSSMVLEGGKDYIVEVRSDVYDNDGTDSLVSGDTIVVNLVSGSSNVYRMSSLSYLGNAAVNASTLTVATGALTLAKYTAYANQTITVPQTAYKIGEFRVSTGNTEGVSVDTFTLAFSGSDVTKLQTVYIVYGTKTTQTKSTVASSSNTFSVSEVIAANATMDVKVYATLPATQNNADTIVSSLTVSGTSQNSGQAVTSSTVTGQTVTVGTGTITSAVDASTPVSANVVANSMPKVASFKFTGTNDSFTVTELTALVGASGAAAVANIVWKDGATTVATQPLVLNNGVYTATSSGISIAVPYNSTKVIDAYVEVGGIGTGFSTTSANVAVTLDGFEYMNSNGVKNRDFTDRAGNAFYAFKTKPTITNVALPTTVLSNGTLTVGKITITSDAAGTVSWRKLSFTVGTTSVVATNFRIYDAANESTILSGSSAVAGVDGNGRVTFTTSVDQAISGSKTYVVKADITGADATGDSLTMSIPALGSYAAPNTYAVAAAAAGSFIWSDESIIGHDATTADWMNDFLVKNLPTDSQTLTK